MALKHFNSVYGFSVGEEPVYVISSNRDIDAGTVTTSGNLTVRTSGNATVAIFSSTGANVTGNVVASGYANITGNLIAGNVDGGNAVVANYFLGNGASLSALTGANVTGQVANALIAGTVYTAAQPNITSVGNLTSLSVVGNLNATGNANANSTAQLKFNLLGSLANPTLQLGNASPSYTPTVDTSILAVGNFTGSYSGITIQNRNSSSTSSTNFYLSADNATETTNYVAYGINGSTYDGGQLMDTGPYSTYLTSTHGDIVFAPQALRGMGNANSTGGNIHFAYDYINDDTFVSKAITITNRGALSVDTVANAGSYTFTTGTAGQVLVSGGANAAISWSNTAPQATTANTAGTVTTAAQPNITSVGTLTSLAVTGNISGGNATITTGLTVGGQTWTDAWTTYSPSWTASTTNPSLGNGALAGRYKQIGKTVYFKIRLTWGSTTTGGTGSWQFSLPVTAQDADSVIAPVTCLDEGTSWYTGLAFTQYGGNATYVTPVVSSNGVTATSPFTWGNTDAITITGTYEAA